MRFTAPLGCIVLVFAGCAASVDEVDIDDTDSSEGENSVALQANASSRTCYAANRDTLMSCYRSLLAHTADRLVITQSIYCAGPEACHLLFDDFVGPIAIVGRTATGGVPAIIRANAFNYPIIDIRNSSKIDVRNIEFREGARNQPAGLFGTPGYKRNVACDQPPFMDTYLRACRPTISVSDESSEVLLDRLFIFESKGFPGAVTFGNVTDVTIRRSTIQHSWTTGIWSTQGNLGPNDHLPFNFRIENNKFLDNRCSGTETAADGGTISGNYYGHNHMGAIYDVQGGQLNPMRHSRDLMVSDNRIVNGSLDEDQTLIDLGWHVPGIEVGPDDIRHLTINHNYIRYNSGYGARHDAGNCGNACGSARP
jgi:hypothetical protein